MSKDIGRQVGDRQASNPAFDWGLALAILLVVAAVATTAFFWSRPCT